MTPQCYGCRRPCCEDHVPSWSSAQAVEPRQPADSSVHLCRRLQCGWRCHAAAGASKRQQQQQRAAQFLRNRCLYSAAMRKGVRRTAPHLEGQACAHLSYLLWGQNLSYAWLFVWACSALHWHVTCTAHACVLLLLAKGHYTSQTCREWAPLTRPYLLARLAPGLGKTQYIFHSSFGRASGCPKGLLHFCKPSTTHVPVFKGA
jgi:hypothetical protein